MGEMSHVVTLVDLVSFAREEFELQGGALSEEIIMASLPVVPPLAVFHSRKPGQLRFVEVDVVRVEKTSSLLPFVLLVLTVLGLSFLLHLFCVGFQGWPKSLLSFLGIGILRARRKTIQ